MTKTLAKNPKMTTMTMTTNSIGRLALEAMLVEVSVTPKPGLVDRKNSGAHRDMGFFTFLKSAAALRSTFDEFASAGSIASRHAVPPAKMLPALRKIGLNAEHEMFEATNGVNTHKGEIFSLGLLSACAGYLGERMTAEGVMQMAAKVCTGLCGRDFADVAQKAELTKGERVYVEYGLTGIRGEAEAGYPCVRNAGLPALKKYLADGHNMNDAMAYTLLHIMAINFDTNIISRHNMQTLGQVFAAVRDVIARGPKLSDIRQLDREFIAHNISPSGSADLLAVTYFLYSLTGVIRPA